MTEEKVCSFCGYTLDEGEECCSECGNNMEDSDEATTYMMEEDSL
jgi:RNA polymerase subunit RPABC4/transcription elongation factor Spt4